MKIETTPMDDLWIGIMTVSVLYLVMRTIKTLEKISKKVDAMVDHIGAEVDSAVSRLSKEAHSILHNLEKNAFGCKENIFQHAQSVEVQCYRSKNGLAFGLAPRTVKKKSSSAAQQSSSVLPAGNGAPQSITSSCSNESKEQEQQQQQHHQQQHQLVALQKCVERILKCKYRWPFHHSSKQQKCSMRVAAVAPQHQLCAPAAH